MRAFVTAISACLVLATAVDAAAKGPPPGEARPDWSFVESGLIPVQGGGRIKPLDSLARETVLFVTGSRTLKGWQPLDLFFSWIAAPGDWEKREIIKIGREDVKKQLLLDLKRSRFSPMELMHNSVLLQYAESYGRSNTVQQPNARVETRKARESEMQKVLDRIGTFRQVVSGHAWRVLPPGPQGDAQAEWRTLADSEVAAGAPGLSDGQKIVQSRLAELIRAYHAGDRELFERTAPMARTSVEGEIPGWTQAGAQKLLAESFYSRLRPFAAAWVVYLLASLLWLFSMVMGRRSRQAAIVFTGAGLLIHVFGFTLRCYVTGRPPVSNMYESVVWVCFGVMAFAVTIYWLQRQKVVMAVACTLVTFGLITADAAPAVLDPGMSPLVPVLRSNLWLTIHVLTITLGYSAFALTLGLGNVALFQYLRSPRPDSAVAIFQRVGALNQLTYRAMQFGVVFLAAGTILGGVWADYSWGRFWGWDPKETWALIALLTYLVILHGRYAGWVGQFGYPAWTVVAFLSVLMAWYGVNFVLGVGLHSYGFADGGTGWVAGFVAAQLAYVLLVTGVRAARVRAQRRAGKG